MGIHEKRHSRHERLGREKPKSTSQGGEREGQLSRKHNEPQEEYHLYWQRVPGSRPQYVRDPEHGSPYYGKKEIDRSTRAAGASRKCLMGKEEHRLLDGTKVTTYRYGPLRKEASQGEVAGSKHHKNKQGEERNHRRRDDSQTYAAAEGGWSSRGAEANRLAQRRFYGSELSLGSDIPDCQTTVGDCADRILDYVKDQARRHEERKRRRKE